jgi:hypothetical protein
LKWKAGCWQRMAKTHRLNLILIFNGKEFDEMEIAINNNDEKNPQKGMFWNIKELNNQTIFTMQNANNITVAQWSPELSSDSC